MRLNYRRRSAVRTSRFESFEPRLVMSAAPAGEMFLDYYIEQIGQPFSPQAPGAPDLSGLSQTQSNSGLSGAGQTVVVIDSGIAYRHTALGGGLGAGYRVVGGYDFAERDDNPYDDGPFGSHGTHVAGIIGGEGTGFRGLATGVDLVALRVFDDAGRGQFSWVEEALRWVHEHRNSFENPITTVNLSLGSAWNSSSTPSWAMLEEELAQLEADGIFIAVAAGNSFTTYNQPGLSYPAASPYVVPVSSVDSDGQLSYFSQRHNRAIAAPGRGIVSTVPDYLGNSNGVDDDYASFSGTSMAAPYVAAASVLLREAYEFVGLHSVTQDTLYDLMRSTADTIYDATTGQNYLRLNLDRALDSILPADDYGSDSSAPHLLGTINGTSTFSGMIGRVDDRDYFQFIAGASGTITFTATTSQELDPVWQLASPTVGTEQAGKTFSFKVVAGQTYTFGLGTRDGSGRYSVTARLEASSSAGESAERAPGGQSEIRDNAVTAAGKWFTLSATNTGIFTVEAMFNAAAGDVDLELFDADNTYLGGSYGVSGYERIDVTATAGQTFQVYAYLNGAGTHGDVDLRITNLVRRENASVSVLGTDGDDTFRFVAGSVVQVSVNGVEYRFDNRAVQSVGFKGFGGNDSAVLEGTAANDIARVASGSAELKGQTYRAEVKNVDSVVLRGGGGRDWVALGDSTGADLFRAQPEGIDLSGNGFSTRLEGFDLVRGSGRRGTGGAESFLRSSVSSLSAADVDLAGVDAGDGLQQPVPGQSTSADLQAGNWAESNSPGEQASSPAVYFEEVYARAGQSEQSAFSDPPAGAGAGPLVDSERELAAWAYALEYARSNIARRDLGAAEMVALDAVLEWMGSQP